MNTAFETNKCMCAEALEFLPYLLGLFSMDVTSLAINQF